MSEPHRTLVAELLAETKIRRSRFIAHLSPCSSVEAAKVFLARISSEHHTATHNCWAYLVGFEGETAHCSDAGEPSGSAGRPILNVLRATRLTNVAAVVTRYYGGVKLGVRGLIEAYAGAVELALQGATLEEVLRLNSYRVCLPYEAATTAKHRIRGLGGRIEDESYAADVSFLVVVEESQADALLAYLTEAAGAMGLAFVEE